MGDRVASFDVFDTLLTRAVGEPEAVALLLGRRLLARGRIGCSAEVFARQRRLAGDRAAQETGGDPPLDAIHAELAAALLLPPEAADDLWQAEKELEFELIRPVAGAQSLVRAARDRGDRVVFVSDTNFREPELRELLDRHDLRRPDDACFTSSDLRVSKNRGTLYPVVRRELAVRADRLVHHGDHPRSDLRHARGSGWRAVHRPQARLNRYETALERHSFATGGLSSALAGASRMARLSQEEDSESALVRVAAGVIGPTLAAWMLQVLQRAQRDGIACLYFLSRDGEVLLDVARRLDRSLQTGVELRYLEGSRTTWLPAAADDETTLESFNLDRDFRSVRTVLASIGLDPDEVAAALPPALSDPARWDTGLAESEQVLLTRAISGPEIRRVALERARRSRELLVDYLRQEGWDRSQPVGLVDVGWRGRIVRALSDVCEAEGMQSPARVYFFGVRHDAHEIVGDRLAPALDGWFYDHASRTGLVRHMFDLEACVEMFCAAEAGGVIGYARSGERVRPVLGPRRADLAEWGLGRVRATVGAFADELVLDSDLVDPAADARHAVNDVLESFWTRPTPDEVAAWSAFPLTIDMFHSRTVRIAEPIRLRRLLGSARRGRVRLRPDMSWPVGTARVSAAPFRAALGGRATLSRELPRVRLRARMTTIGAITAAGRRMAGALPLRRRHHEPQ
jgi:FMN phosphatase YigB (HAD superfamily)